MSSPLMFDHRLSFVPKDLNNIRNRPIFKLKPYPLIVTEELGPDFSINTIKDKRFQKLSKVIGRLDQSQRKQDQQTSLYAIMNSSGLSLSESTTNAKISANLCQDQYQREKYKNCALLSMTTLSHIALENCSTALCAVETMGKQAEQQGFAGDLPGVDEAGESMLIADLNEIWVFHILASDSNGTSAVWAAQRLPSDHISSVTNSFIIREIDLDDKDNFIVGTHTMDVAKKNGWWNETAKLDFAPTFSTGEYGAKQQSGRRLWRIYSVLTGEMYPSEYNDLFKDRPYPVSVKQTKKVSHQDIIDLHRDSYQGTKQDRTKGLASGPFGSPNRQWSRDPSNVHFERTINLNSTSHSYVCVVNPELPHFQFAHGAPATNPYYAIPIVDTNWPRLHDFSPYERKLESTYWISRTLNLIVDLRYQQMILDVKKVIDNYEVKMSERIKSMVELFESRSFKDREGLSRITLKAMRLYQEEMFQTHKQLISELPMKQSDGFINGDDGPVEIDYPDWWLRDVKLYTKSTNYQ